jgi:hypothetical protein
MAQGMPKLSDIGCDLMEPKKKTKGCQRCSLGSWVGDVGCTIGRRISVNWRCLTHSAPLFTRSHDLHFLCDWIEE